MTTNAQHQAAFRARQSQKLARYGIMEAALRDIISELEGRDKPLTNRIRSIAESALPPTPQS